MLRLGKMKDGPVITDNGNFVMDVDFGMIEDPKGLAARISPIPRVVEHGIFDNPDELYLARAGGVEIIGRGEEAKRIFEEHSRPLPINFPKIMIYLRALRGYGGGSSHLLVITSGKRRSTTETLQFTEGRTERLYSQRGKP